MTMRTAVYSGFAGIAVGILVSGSMPAQTNLRVSSPDGKNTVRITVGDGTLRYAVSRNGREIILPSRLGFESRNAPPLGDSVRVVDSARTTVDESWTQPWGEVARVHDRHNELRVTAEEASPRRRLYADGPGANWPTNPLPVTISSRPVDSTTRLRMVLAPGGGQAIRIRPAP